MENAQKNRWKRALLEHSSAEAVRAQADVAIFGGIAFWSDGRQLSCRVIANDSRCMPGFDITLRD